ncbi:MAG: glycine--tRNA ligase subunit beta [Proteobacteria bacterium]|nr:glycine--tRNA ligase subunit beta [Pseudomonadota bacterium]
MPELLLELLSEEIPARMQAKAADDLKRLVCDGLKKAGLEFESAEAFVTPRRLALVVDGLPEKTPDISEERRGPRTDAPDKAVKGFKGSLPKGAKVEKRKTEKGEFYFALVKQKGGQTKEVLPDVLTGALGALIWPKSMRWGENKVRWVRPVHGVLSIFGGKTVAVEFGPVKSADTTQGHPFMAPKPFKVRNFRDYKAKLLKAKVMLDPAERRAVIEAEAQKLAKKAGLALKDDPRLLAEVAGLVEWPVVKMGSIDKAFMDLPPEVLTTVMRHHQKYFALLDTKGKLAPRFIVVANTETRDRGKTVVAGNERVLRARLADAKFFWDQDRKATLEGRLGKLTERVFHAKLGSVHDKVLRIEELAAELAERCSANPGDARWAARLAKADLSTEMVGEFPELQGTMGRYYALADGEKPDVADAIADHYSPLGPNDACPSKPVSIAVALADKIDTLVGFFAIDEKPTGSKDPFALRRAALGVIRLIIENGLRLSLLDSFEIARDQIHPGEYEFSQKIARAKAELNGGGSIITARAHAQLKKNVPGREGTFDSNNIDLLAFFADRLKVHLREKGVKHDHINAVFALDGEDDLVRLLARVDALGAFLKTDDGGNLLTAYKRAANIVRIEEKRDDKEYKEVKTDLFDTKTEIENDLWQNLHAVQDSLNVSLKGEIFFESMAALAQLRPPIDAFFDHVTVNVKNNEKVRANRLALLRSIVVVMDQVADFSKIEGGER